jgi:ribosomal protein L37AE/L43A
LAPTTLSLKKLRKSKLSRQKQTKKSGKSPKYAINGVRKPKNERASPHRAQNACPKCGSTKVFWASGLPQIWSVWECRNCGYRGAFMIRNGELAKRIRTDYPKRTLKR